MTATVVLPVLSVICPTLVGWTGSLNSTSIGEFVGTRVSLFSGLVFTTVGGLVLVVNAVVKETQKFVCGFPDRSVM